MSPIKFQLTVLVLIMLASIMKTFAMDRGPDVRLDPPRSVNLSGNTLTFAIPGHFSRDMPADDLVTQVDINSEQFDQGPGRNLLRRWWDIKEPGFFGKELGTVMLSITVHPTQENRRKRFHDRPFDPRDRFDFIIMIEEFLYWHHQAINQGVEPDEYGVPLYTYPGFTKIGDEVSIPFSGDIFNGQHWLRYSSGGPNSVFTTHYATPIADHAFVEISFTYSLNDNIQSGPYFTEMAQKTTKPIERSLHIDFAEGNPYQLLVEENWHKETINELTERNRHLIDPVFELDGPADPGLEDIRP